MTLLPRGNSGADDREMKMASVERRMVEHMERLGDIQARTAERARAAYAADRIDLDEFERRIGRIIEREDRRG